MIWFLLGLAVLIALVALFSWFVDAKPSSVTRLAAGIGLVIVGVIAIGLFLTGRIFPALLFAGGAGGWLSRYLFNWSWPSTGSPGASGAGGQRKRGRMDRREALEVLGLEGNPDRSAINEAYHRLIKKLHPDQGGNAFLASQINEARQTLLDQLDD